MSNGDLDLQLVQIQTATDISSLTTKLYRFESRFKYTSAIASTALSMWDGSFYLVGSLRSYLNDDLSTTTSRNFEHGFIHQETISTTSLTGNCISLAAKTFTETMAIQGGTSMFDRYT